MSVDKAKKGPRNDDGWDGGVTELIMGFVKGQDPDETLFFPFYFSRAQRTGVEVFDDFRGMG